jgi:hypothetical protein
MKRFRRLLAFVLSLSLVHVTMIQTAHAGVSGLVTTEEVARIASGDASLSGHARLVAALARSDVRAEMERLGIDATGAEERVAALSDDEAARLAGHLGSAPAGGIIGAIVFVFLVLLVTDILGLTKVYPFTRSVR